MNIAKLVTGLVFLAGAWYIYANITDPTSMWLGTIAMGLLGASFIVGGLRSRR